MPTGGTGPSWRAGEIHIAGAPSSMAEGQSRACKAVRPGDRTHQRVGPFAGLAHALEAEHVGCENKTQGSLN